MCSSCFAALVFVLRNFGGLVLGCIEADFCEQTLMLEHLSSSVRFAHLGTALPQKFSKKKSSKMLVLSTIT